MNLADGIGELGTPAAASIVPNEVRQAAAADAAPSSSTSTSSSPGASSPDSTAPAAPSAANFDQDARELVEFSWACFGPLYPSLAPIYTAEVRARIAEAAAPVMRKYNFDLAFLGPELTLVIVLLPLVVPTYQAIRHDRSKEKITEATPAPAPGVNASADIAREADNVGAGAERKPLERFPGLAVAGAGAGAASGKPLA